MRRELYIARGVTELGPLTEREVRELLHDGFLLPTDLYWEQGMADWDELCRFELPSSGAGKTAALVEVAKQKVSSASKSAAVHASDLTRKLKSLAGHSRSRLSSPTTRLLDSFAPQIQGLVSHQLVQQSIACVQDAVQDDDFMRKFFGAIYDCLPKPVCRFVSEEAFIKYCMERRRMMLQADTKQAK